MDETYELLCCPKCGQKMKRIVSRKGNIPWDLMLQVARSDFKFSAMYVFVCPQKHDGALIMRRNFEKDFLNEQHNTV